MYNPFLDKSFFAHFKIVLKFSEWEKTLFAVIKSNFFFTYLLDTIRNRVLDYIYHEHLSYHGIKSLVPFLRKEGLYIYDIFKNLSNTVEVADAPYPK